MLIILKVNTTWAYTNIIVSREKKGTSLSKKGTFYYQFESWEEHVPHYATACKGLILMIPELIHLHVAVRELKDDDLLDLGEVKICLRA